ncbi:viroplasmin family protein [Pseudomonas putida]|jgi:hypothetical protein|uniref:ribonuclease H1 domain-containing protein n=1 Tax=Pseudomonas putida TaxID=303 RepID=UPI0009821712
MAKRTRYYAVVSGKPTGIFNTWDGSAANARRPIKTVCSLPVTGKGFPNGMIPKELLFSCIYNCTL